MMSLEVYGVFTAYHKQHEVNLGEGTMGAAHMTTICWCCMGACKMLCSIIDVYKRMYALPETQHMPACKIYAALLPLV
jgi:hypothetical protein